MNKIASLHTTVCLWTIKTASPPKFLY